MVAKNENGKGKSILKAILPFLALLIALIFVFFLWRYYHPNRTINLHQTHVSQVRQLITPLRRCTRLAS
jgi:hypothetical protein